LKKHLGGRRFAADGEVQQAVMSWLQVLDTDFFYAGIDALVYRWDKCFGKYGDYVYYIWQKLPLCCTQNLIPVCKY
jgi:hypothetical protein